MSFLLKIVEGPNKGAEIALVDGVAVTLGKGDDCDIVLADPTMPDAPLSIEATADGVVAGGEPLAPFAVKTLGATSFAIGPADGQWAELQWPGSGDEAPKDEAPGDEGHGEERPKEEASKGEARKPPENPDLPRGGRLRRVALVAAIAILAALALLFRGVFSGRTGNDETAGELVASDNGAPTFESIVERYGLAMDGEKPTGNFATRRQRLTATAELYAARPGVELDLSDDESLRTAAEDTLALLSEAGLRVASATNRVVALSGATSNIRRVLEVFASDIPKLRDVDLSDVSAMPGGGAGAQPAEEIAATGAGRPARTVARSDDSAAQRSLPVCGILTAPYPCLVLRSGARILEGAPLGDGVVLKINADSVTITNSTGVFTWKP